MLRLFLSFLLLNLFSLTSCQTTSTQISSKEYQANINQKNTVDSQKQEKQEFSIEYDESQPYELSKLKYDYKQVEIVAYVDVKSFEIADFIGEKDKNIGYNLYRLKADAKEVFKGKIKTEAFEFYKIAEMQYPQEYLTGEKIIFLDWSDNFPDGKMSLFTLENSTRAIKYEVLKKMRNIAKKNR